MEDNVKNKIFKFLDCYYEDNDAESLFGLIHKTNRYFPMGFFGLTKIIAEWMEIKDHKILRF